MSFSLLPPAFDVVECQQRGLTFCSALRAKVRLGLMDKEAPKPTIKEVKDRGFWAAFSIYPHSKMTAERMAALVTSFGPEQLIVDSACDWGVSDPLSVPKTAKLMAKQGVPEAAVKLVTYTNALTVYGKSGQMAETDWLSPPAIDQRTLYQGNTVLRGGQTPRVGQPDS